MARKPPLLELWFLLASVLWLSACQPATPTPLDPSPTPQDSPTVDQRTPAPTAVRTSRPLETAAPTPTRAVQVGLEELQGLTIAFWHPFSESESQVLDAFVKQFNQQNAWGIEVQALASPGFGELEEAFRDAQQLGGLPDLLVGYPDQAIRLDRGRNGLVDLHIYLLDYEWGFNQAAQESFPQSIWNETLSISRGQTRRLGLPWYRSGLLLAYNETLARSLGFDSPPATVRNFQSQACAASGALKKDAFVENDGRGGWLIAPDPGNLILWLYAFNAEFFSPGIAGYSLDTIQSREAFSTLSQGVNGDCFWVDNELSPVDAFAEGHALFVSVTPPELAEFSSQLSQAGFSDQWTVLALPGLEGDPVVDFYGPSFLIPATSPERQLAAWAFVRWMSDPKQQAAWAEKTGYLPASLAALPALQASSPSQPRQWRSALSFVALTRGEPARASWGSARWAFGEALARLTSPGLRAGELQTILTSLDDLANDIDSQYP